MPQFVLLGGAAQWTVPKLFQDSTVILYPAELLFNTVGSHFLVLCLKYFQARKN
jgi:hypothetical protein